MRAGDDDPSARVDGARTHVCTAAIGSLAPHALGPAVLAERAVEPTVGSESSDHEGVTAFPHDIDPVLLVDRERLDRRDAQLPVHEAVFAEGGIQLAASLEPSDRDPDA